MRTRAKLAVAAFFYTLLTPAVILGKAELGLDHPRWSDRFDYPLRKYAKRYFGPFFDWRWFKAQAIAESNLRPAAVSHKGARGVMQIMPSTFKALSKDFPDIDYIDDTRWNIASGVFYDRLLFERWRGRVPAVEHLRFTFAAYNAGFRRITQARRRAGVAGGAMGRWEDVGPHAPRETRGYIDRIEGLMRKRKSAR